MLWGGGDWLGVLWGHGNAIHFAFGVRAIQMIPDFADSITRKTIWNACARALDSTGIVCADIC